VTLLHDFITASTDNMNNFIGFLKTPPGLRLILANAPAQAAIAQANLVATDPSFAAQRAVLVPRIRQQQWFK
jgi:hypothetical protein